MLKIDLIKGTVCVLFDPAVVLFRICPKEITVHVWKRVPITVLFAIVRNFSQTSMPAFVGEIGSVFMILRYNRVSDSH